MNAIDRRLAEARNYYPTHSELEPEPPQPLRLETDTARFAVRQAIKVLNVAYANEGLTDAGDRVAALAAELEELATED